MRRRRRRRRLFKRLPPPVGFLIIAILLTLKFHQQQYILYIEDYLAGGLSLAVILFYILRYVVGLKSCSKFGKEPDGFHEQIITIEGKVVHILPDTIFEKAKRTAIDKVRNITGSDDYRRRYIHQRFLVRAEGTIPGSAILVEHNVRYGKLAIRKGSRVRVTGQYLHLTGGRHRYGRIHKTHPPDGKIDVS